MSSTHFRDNISELTTHLAGRPLDAALEAWLSAEHGPASITRAWCRTWLKPAFFRPARSPSYKYPRFIEFLTELPKAATGKIQRFRLRERDRKA